MGNPRDDLSDVLSSVAPLVANWSLMLTTGRVSPARLERAATQLEEQASRLRSIAGELRSA